MSHSHSMCQNGWRTVCSPWKSEYKPAPLPVHLYSTLGPYCISIIHMFLFTGYILISNEIIILSLDDRLVLMPFDPYNRTQQWRLTGVRIQNRYTLKQVLEVKDASMEADACVQMADDDAQAHQQWELQHV